MRSQYSDLVARIAAHNVKDSEMKPYPNFQGPYIDVLYYHRNDNGTYEVQNGDYRVKDMTPSELRQLLDLIDMSIRGHN